MFGSKDVVNRINRSSAGYWIRILNKIESWNNPRELLLDRGWCLDCLTKELKIMRPRGDTTS